ncbi:MAG: ABC transporter substrate-binding protein [Thermodesulfobacteriota bacterium]|nr:ABC transporter substrate-binding protein [Thermodesulfobacteriota bacterium]
MKRRLSMRYGNSLYMCVLAPLFMIFFSSADGYTEPVRGVTDTTIKIGAILDQTGPISGDITLPPSRALRNYIKHVNENGGISERKIELLIEDDRYSIPAGVAAFKKLLFKDKIFALIGPGCIGGGRALIKHIQKLQVPNITGSPDERQVNPVKKYIVMPFNVYDNQLGVIYDYIVNNLKPQKPRVTFVYYEAESGKVALASTKRWADFFNFEYDTEVINMGALDAASQVMNIKRKKPTHIVIHHGSPGTVALLRDLKKFNVDIPVYGTLITCTDDTIKMAGSSGANFRGAQIFGSWYEDLPGIEKMRKITLKYHPGTEKPYRSRMYTLGWLIATILYEGLERAGKDLNTETMVKAWESIKDLDTGGVSGLVNLSPTNHQALHHTKLYKADPEKGILIPITDWRLPPDTK